MRPAIEVVSVNVGRVQTIEHGDKRLTTGICKQPVAAAVSVAEHGLEGDAIVDTRHHGGRDQAVYAYGLDDYHWWSETTGLDFEPGLFGENLTIRGLPTDLPIGERLLIGELVLEATSPRIPCSTLAARMQDSAFGLAFREARRPGVYFRVLNPGEVRARDPIDIVECGARNVTALDLFDFAYATRHDRARLQEFLDAPIAERFRTRIEAALAKTG